MSLPFEEAINQACWDLAAQAGGPAALSPARRQTIRACAPTRAVSISTSATSTTQRFFAEAAAQGYRGFKIKVGHPDLDWDLHRLELLREAVGGTRARSWSTPTRPGRRARRCAGLMPIRRAGFDIFWVEDPCLRDDFDGLREIRSGAPWVHVNSGEYLDLRGKRKLIEARGVDILNVHGHVTDVMRAGWLAAEHGIPVSLGNTMLELGVHMAAALPNVGLARIFVPELQSSRRASRFAMRDGYAIAPDRPGHGLMLSEAARRQHACPDVLARRGVAAGAAIKPDQRSQPENRPTRTDQVPRKRRQETCHEMNRRDVLQALAAARLPRLSAQRRLCAQKASINYWHHFTIDHRVQGARAGDGAVQAEISRHPGARRRTSRTRSTCRR